VRKKHRVGPREKLGTLAAKVNEIIREKGSKVELRKAKAAYRRALRQIANEARALLARTS